MVSVDIVLLLALLVLPFGGAFLIRRGQWILVWSLLNGVIVLISFLTINHIVPDVIGQGFFLMLFNVPYLLSTYLGAVIARIRMLNKDPEPWTKFNAIWAAGLIALVIISNFAFMLSL